MTPKVRVTLAYIQQWSRDNILRLLRLAIHLQDAADDLPAELGELNVRCNGGWYWTGSVNSTICDTSRRTADP